MRLPVSRSADIVVQEAGDELLIYDLKTHKAFCLNKTAARVFNACNGKSGFYELKSKYKFTDDLIFLTLDALRKKNLLEENSDQSPFTGLTRREAIQKVGLGSMIALPVITALIAPISSQAASGCLPACIAAGGNICAGCAPGQVIPVTSYTSANGTCTSAAFSFNQTCPASGAAIFSGQDISRN